MSKTTPNSWENDTKIIQSLGFSEGREHLEMIISQAHQEGYKEAETFYEHRRFEQGVEEGMILSQEAYKLGIKEAIFKLVETQLEKLIEEIPSAMNLPIGNVTNYQDLRGLKQQLRAKWLLQKGQEE